MPTNAETFAAMRQAQQLQQLGSGAAAPGAATAMGPNGQKIQLVNGKWEPAATGPASEDDFLAAARTVNPSATNAELRPYYARMYGSSK